MSRSLEERVRAMYVPGMIGYGTVAKRLGISPSRVREIVVPGYREMANRRSAEAKRQRTGVCEQCGGPTHYAGHGGTGVSRICRSCATKNLNSPEALALRQLWTRDELVKWIRGWEALHGKPPTMRDWRGNKGWPSARSVIYHFGTWNKGIEAAGFTPRRSTPDHQREEARRSTQARPSR